MFRNLSFRTGIGIILSENRGFVARNFARGVCSPAAKIDVFIFFFF